MPPVVVRQGRSYLNQDGYFLAHCVEEAMQFDTPEAATEFVMTREGYEIEFYISALAREDQEYAMQLEDLRG